MRRIVSAVCVAAVITAVSALAGAQTPKSPQKPGTKYSGKYLGACTK